MPTREATWRLARCTSSLCLNVDRQRTAMLERLMSSEGVVSSSFSTCFSSNKSPIELPPCRSIIHPIPTTSSASFLFVRREGQPIYKLFTTEQHSPNPDMALNIICDINIDSLVVVVVTDSECTLPCLRLKNFGHTVASRRISLWTSIACCSLACLLWTVTVQSLAFIERY